jgi:serine/threonine-protein kinase
MLFEMFTGKRAFEDEDVSMTLSKVLQREPDFELLPADVPARVRQTIRLCLRKSLRERVGDMHDVRLALEGAFETVAPKVAPPVTISQWRRDALVGAAALIVGVGLASAAVWYAMRPPPPLLVRTAISTSGPSALNIHGIDRDLAITPDGSRIVYRGVNQLLVRALNQLTPTALSGLGEPRGLFVSPDGQWVGFFDGAGKGRFQSRRRCRLPSRLPKHSELHTTKASSTVTKTEHRRSIRPPTPRRAFTTRCTSTCTDGT